MSLIPPISWKGSKYSLSFNHPISASKIFNIKTQNIGSISIKWNPNEKQVDIYIATKELQYKCGHAAIYSYQYVDAGQNYVGRAGYLKEEWGRVHQRRDGPPGKEFEKTNRVRASFSHLTAYLHKHTLDKYSNACRVKKYAVNLPIQQEQQGQHRQVGGGDVSILLEADENDDDQCGRDNVVTLQEEEKEIKEHLSHLQSTSVCFKPL